MNLETVVGSIVLILSVVQFYLPKEKTCTSFWHSTPLRTICTLTMMFLFGVLLCLFLDGK